MRPGDHVDGVGEDGRGPGGLSEQGLEVAGIKEDRRGAGGVVNGGLAGGRGGGAPAEKRPAGAVGAW